MFMSSRKILAIEDDKKTTNLVKKPQSIFLMKIREKWLLVSEFSSVEKLWIKIVRKWSIAQASTGRRSTE